MSLTKLWLRGETKKNEHRSALTPSVCASLLADGFEIVVERCPERYFADAEFAAYGCQKKKKKKKEATNSACVAWAARWPTRGRGARRLWTL